METTSTIYAIATAEEIIRRISDAAVEFITSHHNLTAVDTGAATPEIHEIKHDVFAALMGRDARSDPEARACEFPWVENILLDLVTVDRFAQDHQRQTQTKHVVRNGLGLPCLGCASCYESGLPECPFCMRRQHLKTNARESYMPLANSAKSLFAEMEPPAVSR
jgi:hypothetical protein